MVRNGPFLQLHLYLATAYRGGSVPDMTPTNDTAPVMELRVALTTNNYERLVNFYCIGLGLEPAQLWAGGDDHAIILHDTLHLCPHQASERDLIADLRRGELKADVT